MNTLKTSCVNSAQSYFSLKNYNNIKPGLVVGPKEPSQTPSMNPQIVLNYNATYNPYDSLTYDSPPGNYYTVSTGQYGSKTCEINAPRACVGVKKSVRSPMPTPSPRPFPQGSGVRQINSRGIPNSQTRRDLRKLKRDVRTLREGPGRG